MEQIKKDLQKLTVEIENRHPGSIGNKQAAAYIRSRFEGNGLDIKTQTFDCIDWEKGSVDLRIGEGILKANISPYSMPCDIEANFVVLRDVEELKTTDLKGRIAVLTGELSKEQYMPKSFEFYNPEHHREVIRILEEKSPEALVCITSKNPEMAGAVYPFPLFDDGDFDIPSVYLTEEEGQKILERENQWIQLEIRSKRIPSGGMNVIGIINKGQTERIVIVAHLDTKPDTPGALDNGTGIAVLLTLSDWLKDYCGRYEIHLLAVNGEDYYSNPGEMAYLETYKRHFKKVKLAINIDGAACKGYRTTYSGYELSQQMEERMKQTFADDERYTAIEPWYQGDHMIFVMNKVSAIAITSENVTEILRKIAHSPMDTIDQVDFEKVSDAAEGIFRLIESMEKM